MYLNRLQTFEKFFVVYSHRLDGAGYPRTGQRQCQGSPTPRCSPSYYRSSLRHFFCLRHSGFLSPQYPHRLNTTSVSPGTILVTLAFTSEDCIVCARFLLAGIVKNSFFVRGATIAQCYFLLLAEHFVVSIDDVALFEIRHSSYMGINLSPVPCLGSHASMVDSSTILVNCVSKNSISCCSCG